MANTSQPSTARVALILGLTGAIGGATAAALQKRGILIRSLTRRRPDQRPVLPYPVEWIEGDAMDRPALMEAATGADVIVHAINPPGYVKWRELAIPMLASTIEAAAASNATILFPANVYVFNAQSDEVVNEDSPKVPTTRKGQVRLEMETMLAAAAARRGVRVIGLRAGDFFGPGVVNSWFAQAMVKDGWSTSVIRNIPRRGIGHSWAYVPDLAETFARLVDCGPTLASYEMLHFAGHYDAPGQTLAQATKTVIGNETIKIKSFVWPTVYLAAPFSPFMREVIEMLWLWRHPLRLDNTRLVSLIGTEPHTPLHDAVAAALGPRPLSCAKVSRA